MKSSNYQLLLLCSVGLAVSAQAQITSKPAQLEEILVTAQKRSQNLTDVPISISALSAESIENSGAKRLSDLTNLVPNVNISQTTDLNARVTIRGVGAQSRNIGFDTRVGVYLDGVYLGQSPALNQELGDLQQIEILRGPQGTLFGKNTVAGAINLITAAPSTEEFFGSATASAGNYELQQLKANINVPVNDNLAVSLSANDMERDGPTKNIYNGVYVGDRNVTNYRAQILWQATDAITARLAVDGLDSDQTSLGREPASDVLGLNKDITAPGRHTINMNRGQEEQREVTGGALTLDFDLVNDYSLKSISSYRETDFFTSFDLDFGPYDYSYVDYGDNYEQTTQEFQLISPEFDGFNYVVGLYYFQQDSATSRDVVLASEADQFIPILVPGERVTSAGTVETESFAMFANGSYKLSDQTQLTLGFRWSTEEKTVDWALDGRAASFFVGTGAVIDNRRDTDFSPSMALNYFVDEDITLYARIAQGYKSGGYNLDFNSQDTIDDSIEFD